MVNESGEVPIKRLNLTHGMSYINRLYVDLNVNGLDEAVLTNRAGFIEDNPKFVSFIEWLKRTLNAFIREVDEAQKSEEENTAEVISQALSSETAIISKNEEFKNRWSEIEEKSGIFNKKIEKILKKSKLLVSKEESLKNRRESQFTNSVDELKDLLNKITLGGKTFSIEVKPLGKNASECSLSKGCKKLLINKDSSFYKAAEKISIEALRLNCLKSMMIELALLMADKDIKIFKETYETFTKQEIEPKTLKLFYAG